MRNLILLMAALVITSCQKDDVDELKSVPPEGPSGIVSKASSLTSKTDLGYGLLDIYTAEELNMRHPALTELPVFNSPEEVEAKGAGILGIIDELDYAYEWFTIHRPHILDRPNELEFSKGLVVLRQTANSLSSRYYGSQSVPTDMRAYAWDTYLDVQDAYKLTAPVIQEMYDILAKYVSLDDLKVLEVPKTIDIRSQDNKIEQADVWNNTFNIEFYGELIAINEWQDQLGIGYQSYTYEEIVSPLVDKKILSFVYAQGHFKGIVQQVPYDSTNYKIVYEANDYTVLKDNIEKCREFLMQTRVTYMGYNSDRLSSLEDRVRNDRQKVKFDSDNQIMTVLYSSGMMGKEFTMNLPSDIEDNCGVGF